MKEKGTAKFVVFLLILLVWKCSEDNSSPKKQDKVKAKYAIFCKLTPMGEKLRLSVRFEDIATAEIIDSFDFYIKRKDIKSLI